MDRAMSSSQWEPDEAPDWFWELIDGAHGDSDCLRELAIDLPLDNLRAAYDTYKDLASFVMRSDIDEDPAQDIANWGVSQGKRYYFDVYEEVKPSPDELPPIIGASSFLGVLITVFMDRYGVGFSHPKAPR